MAVQRAIKAISADVGNWLVIGKNRWKIVKKGLARWPKGFGELRTVVEGLREKSEECRVNFALRGVLRVEDRAG